MKMLSMTVRADGGHPQQDCHDNGHCGGRKSA